MLRRSYFLLRPSISTHQYNQARDDEGSSASQSPRERLTEQESGEDKCDENASFIYERNKRDGSFLHRPVVANPGQSGREGGKRQQQVGSAARLLKRHSRGGWASPGKKV